MSAAAFAVAEDDQDEVLAGHEPCACGALADVVLVEEEGAIAAVVRCGCGSFRPAAGEGDRP